MANGKTTGAEPFTVAVEIEGTASSGLAAFVQEWASAEVEGIGRVSVMSNLAGSALFISLPTAGGVGWKDSPPTLYTIPLKALAEAALAKAIERFGTGEPAVWHDTPGDMDILDISAELDKLEKTATVPGSMADKLRGERIRDLRGEVARRAGEAA